MKKLLEVKDRVIAGLEEFNKQSLFGIGYEDTMSMVQERKVSHLRASKAFR